MSFQDLPPVTLCERNIGAFDIPFSLHVKLPLISILKPIRDVELLKERVIDIFNTEKEIGSLSAPLCMESPFQLAFTFHEPKQSGMKLSLYEPLVIDNTVLFKIDESGLV